ncbi:MAG: heavy metal translocating P-type ATPase [Chloroflexi bacterium]|nr:heavy metal translocating P-type ATPase [Chloroflexota bacterium]
MLFVDALLKPYKKQQKKRRADRYLRAPQRVEPEIVMPTDLLPTTIQTFVQSLRWGEVRHEQLKQIDAAANDQIGETPGRADDYAVGAEEQAINRNLMASATGLGLAAVGMFFYGPLALVSVPFTLYASVDVLRDAKTALVEERSLRHAMLDATVILSALVSHYYLASALASLTYYTGHKLMAMTEDNTEQALRTMLGEQTRTVWRLLDGVEVEAPFAELKLGDVLVVSAGDIIPVDGTVVQGLASIDQRLLSGEARPVEKALGDPVYAGTALLAGRLYIEVERAGADTVAAQIGETLRRTADFKSSIQAKGEEISDRSVLPTLGLSAVTLAALGPGSAIAVIGANYAEILRMVAPLGMLNFLSKASQRGILIKDGRALELLNQIDTVVFDKTGTLTLEQPHVAHIYTWNGLAEAELLILAAAAEARQTHPVAKAILQAAHDRQLVLPTIDEARYEMGYGIKVSIAEQTVHVGSLRFMDLAGIPVAWEVQALQTLGHEQGSTFVYVAVDGRLDGAIELHATLRPEAQQMIQQLKMRNLDMYIISGDHQEPTRRLALELGIEHYFAEVLPEAKAELVARLQSEGRFVCFVGDGINDAIALKQAHTSISLRGASTIATDTAQIILTNQSLTQLDHVFELAQRFQANQKVSYVTTFGPGLFCLGGIFFFRFQILSALICYNASLVAGLTNALLPILRREPDDRITTAIIE